MSTTDFTPTPAQERGYAIALGLANAKTTSEIASDLGIDIATVERYATRKDVLAEAGRIAAAATL